MKRLNYYLRTNLIVRLACNGPIFLGQSDYLPSLTQRCTLELTEDMQRYKKISDKIWT